MLCKLIRPFVTAVNASALALFAFGVQADGYGIFEPEALSMGGAAVAIASPGNAVFYNPALLAQHRYDEDNGKHGRWYFPSITAQGSQSLEDIYKIEDDRLADNVSDSVDLFNATPNAANAGLVVDASSKLLRSLEDLQGDPLYTDGFAGLVIAEPSDQQGGAFYIGGRAFGDGNLSDIADQDFDLLNDYIEGLQFVASGGQTGVAHPELFDGAGGLVDPSDNLVSTASAAGAVAWEMGVAFAKQFEIDEQGIAFGITPKVMLIKTFDAQLNVAENRIDTSEDDQWRRRLNADLGIASKIGHFNVALAVKDIARHRIRTPAGQDLIIAPKPRLGIGYLGQRFKVGFDYDIIPIESFADGDESQDWSLGAQWQIRRKVALRVGYRQDLQDNHGSAISAGVGITWGRFLMDFAFVESEDTLAGAFQIGLKI